MAFWKNSKNNLNKTPEACANEASSYVWLPSNLEGVN
jgi:hypothetical protein